MGGLARIGLLLVLASTFVAAQEAVRIEVDDGNPPFMYARGGKAAGLYPALLRAVFDTMHVPLALDAKPWRRALTELDAGTVGVGGIYKTEERARKYDYSEPLFVEQIVVCDNRRKPVGFKALPDLYGKRIGLLNGWSYGDTFDQVRKAGRLIGEEVRTDALNFAKLQLGRLDAVLIIKEAAAVLLEDGNYPEVQCAAEPLVQNPTYLAFHKNAHRQELLQAFDKALRALRGDDMRYQQIVTASFAGKQ
jgi:polar amino acid transport system substrate-binding protein